MMSNACTKAFARNNLIPKNAKENSDKIFEVLKNFTYIYWFLTNSLGRNKFSRVWEILFKTERESLFLHAKIISWHLLLNVVSNLLTKHFARMNF